MLIILELSSNREFALYASVLIIREETLPFPDYLIEQG